jgi:hypothetical protein
MRAVRTFSVRAVLPRTVRSVRARTSAQAYYLLYGQELLPACLRACTRACVCVRVRARARLRVRVRARVSVRVRACVCVCEHAL